MEKALEIVLSLVIIGATLAFGGVEPIAYSFVEVCLFLAVLVLLFKQARQGRIHLKLPLWLSLFGFLVIAQMVAIPSWLVREISPARFLGSDLVGQSSAEPAWTTLSIYPHDTVLALLKFLAYLSAFLLAAYLFDSRRRKSIIVRVMIFTGLFEAVYGIFQYLTGWQKIFTFTKEYDTASATGTYINRNHFAGLLELTLPFVIAAIFYYFQLWLEQQSRSAGRRPSRGASSPGFRSIVYLFLLVIMAIGVVFSHSRMGIMATALSVVFVAMLAQLGTRRKVWMLGLFVFLVCVVGYALWIGLDSVLARFEGIQGQNSLGMEGRTQLWKDELRLVRDYPLVGTGLGTFENSFRRYQTTLVENFVDHAHNDYLEFASETGLLGVTLLFFPILYLLVKMIVSFLDDPRGYRRSITLGCIGSSLALLIHSLVDFNLQIPANGLIFATVLGIGYKAVCVERKEEGGVAPTAQAAQQFRSAVVHAGIGSSTRA